MYVPLGMLCALVHVYHTLHDRAGFEHKVYLRHTKTRGGLCSTHKMSHPGHERKKRKSLVVLSSIIFQKSCYCKYAVT